MSKDTENNSFNEFLGTYQSLYQNWLATKNLTGDTLFTTWKRLPRNIISHELRNFQKTADCTQILRSSPNKLEETYLV